MSKGFSPNVTDALHVAAIATLVPEELLRALAWVESSGNPLAVGPKLKNGGTAKGLLQLLDATAQAHGAVDSFDPYQNAMAGAKYLSKLLNQFGAIDEALAAYNWGPGNLNRARRDGATYPTQVLRYVQRVKDRWALEDGGRAATELPAPPSSPTTVASCTNACPVHCHGGKS